MNTRLFVTAVLFGITVLPLSVLIALQVRQETGHLLGERDEALVSFSQGAARDLGLRVDRMLDNARADVAIPGLAEVLQAPAKADKVWVNRVLTLVSLREPVNTISVALLDRDGRDLADTQPQRVGSSEAAEYFFSPGIAHGYPRVFGPQRADDGRRTLFVTAPIKQGNEALGLLRIRLQGGLVGQVLAESLIDRVDVQAAVFDTDGRLHGWSDPALQETDAVPIDMVNPPPGALNFDWRSQAWRGAVAAVPGTELRVMTYLPRNQFDAPVRAKLRDAVLLMAVLALLGLGAAWSIAARLTRGLTALSASAEAMAEGDLQRRVPVRGTAELRRVSQAFNLMGERLAENLHALSEELAQRRQAEAALRESEARLQDGNLRLEAQVRERTADLASAKDAAEAASRAKSSFLANISHEIRTPMNAIIGLTRLLDEGSADPLQRDRLAKVDGAAHHLMGLINDVLDLSRIEAGKLSLETVTFSPRALVERMVGMVELSARDKGLQLRTEQDERLPALLQGDERRLGQVLLNFLGNAVKFTSQGEVGLRAQWLRDEGAQVWLGFEVWDTGIGLTPEQQARVFDAFEQADASTTRQFGGTGLGLTISRELCQLMGGQIGVASQPGEGSRFWIALPLLRQAEADASALLAPSVLPQWPGQRVLVVDDNPVNLEVMQAMLGRHGLVVDCASDGVVASTLAQRHPYSLMLMDMHMPLMDGLEATRRIRRLPMHTGTPILAMTANVYEDDRQRCRQAGMNAHLGKPIDALALQVVLAAWLGEPSAGGS